MVQLSEKLLQKDNKYREEALTYRKWLNCEGVLNPECRVHNDENLEHMCQSASRKVESSALAKLIIEAQQKISEVISGERSKHVLYQSSVEINQAFIAIERRLIIREMAREQYKNEDCKIDFLKDDQTRNYHENCLAWEEQLKALHSELERKKDNGKDKKSEEADQDYNQSAVSQKSAASEKGDHEGNQVMDNLLKKDKATIEEIEKKKIDFERRIQEALPKMFTGKINSFTRPRDQLHLCYSQYMLIQTKLKYGVYERAINIFEDVTQCQRDMRKL